MKYCFIWKQRFTKLDQIRCQDFVEFEFLTILSRIWNSSKLKSEHRRPDSFVFLSAKYFLLIWKNIVTKHYLLGNRNVLLNEVTRKKSFYFEIELYFSLKSVRKPIVATRLDNVSAKRKLFRWTSVITNVTQMWPIPEILSIEQRCSTFAQFVTCGNRRLKNFATYNCSEMDI